MNIFHRLLALAWRHPRHLLAAYICLMASSGFALAVPYLLGTTVDEVLQGGTFRQLVYLTIAILILNGMRGIFAYGQTYLTEWSAQLVAYDLRNSLFTKLQAMSFAYHDVQQTGNLMSKATADVEAIRMFVQAGVLRTMQIVVLLIGTVGVMFYTNWHLALLFLVIVPIIVWRSTVMNFRLRKLWLYIQSITGKMTTVMQENLAGVRVVRAFGAEHHEQKKFDVVIADMSDSTVEATRLQASNISLLLFLFAMTTGAVLAVGGLEIQAGRLTPGELAQFVFYLGLIQAPLRMSGFIINSFSRAASAGERLFEVLDATSPVTDPPVGVDLRRASGHVVFDKVSFSYSGQSRALEEISFEAKPGQIIAMLGAPGSGKTTIAHLIPRFYDVTSGKITMDGIDIRETTLESLRRNVGIAMQDVFLFSATIRENIAYGSPGSTQGDIEKAATVAQIHDFIIQLPEGYDTWVGERGITLSGGQRQRLTIARTILLNPPVLILDDSTSSVDAGTEHSIRTALGAVMEGRTTFVIAHRLSTVRNADLTVVLDHGQIVQRGNHETLIREPGLYQQIYQLQLHPDDSDISQHLGTNGNTGHLSSSRGEN